MNTIFSKSIAMNVTTYENLNFKGEQIVFLLKKLFNEFLTYVPIELLIEITRMNGRVSSMKFNEKNLNKLYKLLINGEVQKFYICDYYEHNEDPYENETQEPNHYPWLFTLGVTCNCKSDYSPQSQQRFLFFNDFCFSLSERLFNYFIPMNIQSKFIELFHNILYEINGITGFITYETTSGAPHMRTAFEDYHRLFPYNRPGYLEHVRGYFWMNYLNEKHISKLGGSDYVFSKAPCEIKKFHYSGIILQLTEDINHYSNDQLRVLRDFLLPLFPADTGKADSFFEYEKGYITRLVE